ANVCIDQCRQGPAGAALRQSNGGAIGCPQPALGGNFPVAGVDTDDDLAGVAAAQSLDPVGVAEGSRADDEAGDAPAERLGNAVVAAQATAELTGNAGRLGDPANGR